MAGITPIATYTLTLTSANTNYNIATLIAAINSAERKNFAQVVIVGYPGIDGVGANTSDVLVGDASLATTRFFLALGANDQYTFYSGDGSNGVCTPSLFVRSAGAGQKINVLLRSS